jgi:lipoyl(octanoyl) transferase
MPAVVCHLLGLVEFESCVALQHRLVYEASTQDSGQITLLVCEHPTGITIGRQGSRGDVHLDSAALCRHQVDVRWTNRGGGALVHGPGQLAVYPIVPLEYYGLSVGEFMDLFSGALAAALTEEGFSLHTLDDRRGLWGRTGQVVAMGAAVRNWVTYFGAYINVAPAMRLVRMVDAISGRHSPMSCLSAERQQPARMPSLRERVARQVSAAFGCARYHMYTGHPLLVPGLRPRREATARAG